MSICSRCGHNSVFHHGAEDGGCLQPVVFGSPSLEETRLGATMTTRIRARRCGCELRPADFEFRADHDEKGSLRREESAQ